MAEADTTPMECFGGPLEGMVRPIRDGIASMTFPVWDPGAGLLVIESHTYVITPENTLVYKPLGDWRPEPMENDDAK